jgi:cell wall-associated NlpC family hydrolase
VRARTGDPAVVFRALLARMTDRLAAMRAGAAHPVVLIQEWSARATDPAILTRAIAALIALGLMATLVMTTRPGGKRPTTDLAATSSFAPFGDQTPTVKVAPQVASKPNIPLAPPTTLAKASGAPAPAPPPVAKVGKLHEADALVALSAPITPDVLKQLASLPQVDAVEAVDAGNVQLQGGPAATIGVDPNTFRNFTPQVTASSDPLWQYIAGGSLGSSFEMARDRSLTLGSTVPVLPAGALDAAIPSAAALAATLGQAATIAAAALGKPAPAPAPADPTPAVAAANDWLGAFMSVGLPGVDLVVSRAQSAALNLTPDSAVIMSAPKADPVALQEAIKKLLPHSTIELMRPGVSLGGPGGSFIPLPQMSTVIAAALSRVGLPYVWGATGPNSFDCSGLMGWSYAQAGIALPRVAAQQALAGPQVPLDKLQPGDLLFWAYDPNLPSYIDHVAMYLGGGMMVVAPHTGDVVKVAKVPTQHLVGAIRVDPSTAAKVGTVHFGA